MLDDFSLRAARHQARQAPQLPLVMPVPPRKHPMWSGNNEIGREIIFDAGSLNTQMVIKMTEWDEPIQRTISLGMFYDESVYPVTPFAFGIVAKLTIGVGGSTQEIIVDWIQGTTVTVTANAVIVEAQYDLDSGFSTLQAGSDVVPPGLRLSALIAKGERPSRPPTRTKYLSTIAPTGSSNIFQIPYFAKEVMLLDGAIVAGRPSVYDATTHLELLANPTAGAATLAIVAGNNLIGFAANGYPILNGAKNFRVTNGHATEILNARAIFKLAL